MAYILVEYTEVIKSLDSVLSDLDVYNKYMEEFVTCNNTRLTKGDIINSLKENLPASKNLGTIYLSDIEYYLLSDFL